jgi:hypothetical protein
VLETTEAELQVRPLFCIATFCTAIFSDCSSAADEVHDDGDHGKEEQQVDEEAAHVQDEESSKPEQDQHNSQNKKHEMTFFLEAVCRAGRECYQVI